MDPTATDKAVRFAEMARHVDEGIHALNRRALRDAIAAFERAYRVAKEADLGTDALVGTLRNLALARREAGDHGGALAAYRLALHTSGISDSHKAAVLHGLGIIYFRLGSYRRAKALLSRAHALWQQALEQATAASESAEVRTERVRVALDLSCTLRALGRYDEAHRLLQAILDDLAGVEPSWVPAVYLELARIAMASGHHEKCRSCVDRALRALRSGSAANPALEAQAELVQAELLLGSGHYRSALPKCARAVDLGARYRLWEELRDAHRLLHTALSRARLLHPPA